MSAAGRLASWLALLALLSGCRQGVPPPPRRPQASVLLITIDTLRADALGCYGKAGARTPHVDRLAREGVLAEFAHAHAVVTLPSHASILTGLYPFQHGVRDNAGFRLSGTVDTLATWLGARGWATGAFVGAFPLDARFGLDRGFDVYDDRFGEGGGNAEFALAERRADAVVEAAREWLRGIGGRPWFCWVHLFDPHAPYAPPPGYGDGSHPYQGEVDWMDAALGPLIDEVRGLAAEGGLVTVFTADHGEALGEHGELTHGLFAYEETLKVPLLFHAPGVLGARRVGEPLRHVDIAPTLLDFLGVEVPRGLAGGSRLGLLAGGEAGPSQPSYFEALAPSLGRGWAPLVGVLVGHEKAIDLPIPELYDLRADPREARNLAGERPERLRELLDVLHGLAGDKVEARAGEEPPEVVERLRSLGYLGGQAQPRERYTEQDDPKRLLDLDRALHQAVDEFQRGRPEAAETTLRGVLGRRPDLGVARLHLAFVLHERGLLEEAVTELREALRLGHAPRSVLPLLGNYLVELGRAEEAVRLLEGEGESKDPELLNALGVALASAGSAERARGVFERILAIDPTNGTALQNLGTLELGAGRTGPARAFFERAVRLDGKLAEAWNGLGVVQVKGGDLEGAARSWSRAVEANPRSWNTLYNLGLLLYKQGRIEEARLHFQAFAAGAPREQYARDLEEVARFLEGTK